MGSNPDANLPAGRATHANRATGEAGVTVFTGPAADLHGRVGAGELAADSITSTAIPVPAGFPEKTRFTASLRNHAAPDAWCGLRAHLIRPTADTIAACRLSAACAPTHNGSSAAVAAALAVDTHLVLQAAVIERWVCTLSAHVGRFAADGSSLAGVLAGVDLGKALPATGPRPQRCSGLAATPSTPAAPSTAALAALAAARAGRLARGFRLIGELGVAQEKGRAAPEREPSCRHQRRKLVKCEMVHCPYSLSTRCDWRSLVPRIHRASLRAYEDDITGPLLAGRASMSAVEGSSPPSSRSGAGAALRPSSTRGYAPFSRWCKYCRCYSKSPGPDRSTH